MLSALTNLVPILDSSNYQQWAPPMRNFLKSQGQWLILAEDNPVDWYLVPIPTIVTNDDPVDEEATATEKNKGKERAHNANPEETSAPAPCPPSPKPAGPIPPLAPVTFSPLSFPFDKVHFLTHLKKTQEKTTDNRNKPTKNII